MGVGGSELTTTEVVGPLTRAWAGLGSSSANEKTVRVSGDAGTLLGFAFRQPMVREGSDGRGGGVEISKRWAEKFQSDLVIYNHKL